MSAHILGLVDRLAAMFGAGVTGRTASVDFGPTPATRYPLLALYSDRDLIRRDRDELLAEVKALHTPTRKAVAR
ncbi:MAG TPA: hypothetical protein VIR00_08405 [Micromonosporaceae bacterium]